MSEKNTKAKSGAVSRRRFVKSASVAAGALALPSIVPSRVLGADAPSNRVAMGYVGVGSQGGGNMGSFHGNKQVTSVAVCDVDSERREKARARIGVSAEAAYNDYRELLARDDIDAVSVGAPDHWHIPISIAAVKSGKDVFCEKPLSLTIGEGRALCNAVKQYGAVFQTGSMQRSSDVFRIACQAVQSGRIGQLKKMIVGIPGNNRSAPDPWAPQPIPDGFDYDMWLGPAPWAPYHSLRCHYCFRFILDYSGGQVTNWGAHYLDIAQWGAAADDTGPVEMLGKGEWPADGLYTTSTRVNCQYKYANGVELDFHTGGGSTRFEGDEGWIEVNRGKVWGSKPSLVDPKFGPNDVHLYFSRDHKGNFLDCIKTRKDPICSAEVGHRSASVCHLANIAMILERPLVWDPKKEQFKNDAAANRLVSRPMRSPFTL